MIAGANNIIGLLSTPSGGGIAMIATPAPEGVERSPLMLFAPAIIQLVLGAIKIVKS